MRDGTARLSKEGEQVYHFSAISCFAEYAVVPQESCVPLSRDVPATIAALIGCAVTTGVGAVQNTAKVKPGSSVAVLAGATKIIAVDLVKSKLMLAKEFGATDTLLASDNMHKQIRKLTEGRGADYVFEAIGNPAVQEQALMALRPGGTLVLEGIAPMGSETNLPGALITRRELTIMGSYYGSSNTAEDFPMYADLYRQGKLDLDRLISKTYALDEINAAYEDLVGGKIARGVIVF